MMHLFKIAPRHSKILRAAAISPLLAVMALRAQEQSDDTYADLDKPGPVITIRGNQGYETYALMEWEDGTKIDARDAHWSSFGWGREIHDPKVNDTTRNGYPIQIGADWIGAYPIRRDLYNYGNCPDPRPTRLYLIGGVIEGTQPLGATWIQSKAANGGGITLNAMNSVIDGMRIHNIHDPFVPLQGNNFTIQNCWVSFSRDDAIENDGFAAGLVEDCLFEDTYCFYSARNTRPDSGKQAEAPGGGRRSVVSFQNNLIGLGNLPGANSAGKVAKDSNAYIPGFGHFWKQGDPRNPKIVLVNNMFFIPKPYPGCTPGRYDVMPQGLKHAEGNIVIWMGEGEYPFRHKGFKVLKGAEGMAYWEKARADWIARHPKVPRVKGDPGYDSEKHGAAEPPPPELTRIAMDALKGKS